MKKIILNLFFFPFHFIFYLFSCFALGTTLTLSFILIYLGLILVPFSRKLFYAWIHKIAGYWISFSSLWIKKFIRINFTGEFPEKNKNIFVIANHQFMLDTLLINSLAARFGVGGEIKFFSKKSIGNIPVFGWCLRILGYIMLKRLWSEDRDFVLKAFSKIRDNNFKFWLVSFPEGTRFKKEKLEKSNAIAQKKNLPTNRYTLLPRHRGFMEAIDQLQDRLNCICDITIAYVKKPALITYTLAGYTQGVHIDMRILEKTNKEEASDFLTKRFMRKEKLMESFYKNHCFPKEDI